MKITLSFFLMVLIRVTGCSQNQADEIEQYLRRVQKDAMFFDETKFCDSVRDVLVQVKEDHASVHYVKVGSDYVGILNRFFSEDYLQEDDKFLFVYSTERKLFLLFINNSMDTEGTDTLNVNELFMPTYVEALAFDEQRRIKKSFRVYSQRSETGLPRLWIEKKSKTKFMSLMIQVPEMITYEQFNVASLKQIIEYSERIVRNDEGKILEDWHETPDPKKNFFIGRWGKRK